MAVAAGARAQNPQQLSPALQQLAGQTLEAEAARAAAVAAGLKVESRDSKTGRFIQLVRIDNGTPIYYTTCNVNAAVTVSTNRARLVSSPQLLGTGILMGIWDGDRVHTGHQELTGRVTWGDTEGSTRGDHATHVAGTLIAAGVDPAARGMAPSATLRSFGWTSDTTEMLNASDIRLSNHSYGQVSGWSADSDAIGGWVWYGAFTNQVEDWEFGRYNSTASSWDNVAHSRKRYLIVKAAGNDRTDIGPGNNAPHEHAAAPGSQYTDLHRSDGAGCCLAGASCAKNVLVVGAVEDVPTGWVGPGTTYTLTSFSSIGPTDDRRIKPDIVANGASLYSCLDGVLEDGPLVNNEYGEKSGTSMSSPNAAGSAALLVDYWRRLSLLADDPLSSTLRGLFIHTARSLSDEPDFFYGWGLMDTQAAAVALKESYYARNGAADMNTGRETILESSLTNGQQFDKSIVVRAGQRVRVTLCWTDPAHSEITGLNTLTPALVNDLDLRVIRTATGTAYQPWRLQPGSIIGYEARNDYADADGNVVDNVEVVEFVAPASGEYTVRVTHKGTITGLSQEFSLNTGTVHRRIMRLQASSILLFILAQLQSSTGSDGGAVLMDSGIYSLGGPMTIAQPVTLMSAGGDATLQ